MSSPTSLPNEENSLPNPIDRIAPTQHPRRRPVMRQDWWNLLFLHWTLPPEVVRPLVPAELELDLYQGEAYVGLIPFTMTGVRPVGCPTVPWLSRFHETNLRTYVHWKGRDPGVWFFSLDAANPVAVRLARKLFHLPYYRADMILKKGASSLCPEKGSSLPLDHDRGEPIGPGVEATSSLPELTTALTYEGTRRTQSYQETPRYKIRAEIDGPVQPARPGTLDHFLVERYILYSAARGRLYQGRVHHTPYPLQRGRLVALEESLFVAAGIHRPQTQPLVHFASGVSVEVFALQRPPVPPAPPTAGVVA